MTWSTSLVAKGLTTGEVEAHLGQIYGAEVSRKIISAITDRVLEGLAGRQSLSCRRLCQDGRHDPSLRRLATTCQVTGMRS